MLQLIDLTECSPRPSYVHSANTGRAHSLGNECEWGLLFKLWHFLKAMNSIRESLLVWGNPFWRIFLYLSLFPSRHFPGCCLAKRERGHGKWGGKWKEGTSIHSVLTLERVAIAWPYELLKIPPSAYWKDIGQLLLPHCPAEVKSSAWLPKGNHSAQQIGLRPKMCNAILSKFT